LGPETTVAPGPSPRSSGAQPTSPPAPAPVRTTASRRS
jgi:hypothetical protein